MHEINLAERYEVIKFKMAISFLGVFVGGNQYNVTFVMGLCINSFPKQEWKNIHTCLWGHLDCHALTSNALKSLDPLHHLLEEKEACWY